MKKEEPMRLKALMRGRVTTMLPPWGVVAHQGRHRKMYSVRGEVAPDFHLYRGREVRGVEDDGGNFVILQVRVSANEIIRRRFPKDLALVARHAIESGAYEPPHQGFYWVDLAWKGEGIQELLGEALVAGLKSHLQWMPRLVARGGGEGKVVEVLPVWCTFSAPGIWGAIYRGKQALVETPDNIWILDLGASKASVSSEVRDTFHCLQQAVEGMRLQTAF